mmetsp:Transcript_2509/g.4071  ORF Transcript_2509/g.4071 Transcript_2509/m.4071 type:complete len:105 (-) Transcript_2509:56-370(-)
MISQARIMPLHRSMDRNTEPIKRQLVHAEVQQPVIMTLQHQQSHRRYGPQTLRRLHKWSRFHLFHRPTPSMTESASKRFQYALCPAKKQTCSFSVYLHAKTDFE